MLIAVIATATSADAAPGDDVGAQALPRGRAWLALVDQRSLSIRTVGAPWSIAVDGAIGVTARLTVGVSHSAAALGRVRGGGGLCRESSAHGCPSLYAGGYVDARWRVPGAASLVVLGRLGVDGVTPIKPVVRGGVVGRARRGRWWVVAQPEIAVSLGNRDDGNRDALSAPVWGGVELGPIATWFETGLRGQLVGFGDKVEIRAGLGVAAHWRRWTVGVSAGFPQLLGPQNSARLRVGSAWLAVAL